MNGGSRTGVRAGVALGKAPTPALPRWGSEVTGPEGAIREGVA